MGNSDNFGYVDCIEMEMMVEELLGMAVGLFLGISVMGYIVWELFNIWNYAILWYNDITKII